MNIKTISSGSMGNCYIIEDRNGNQIVLECGIKYEKILPHINFERIDCVLGSHFHKDHFMCADKFKSALIDVYSPENSTAGKLIKLKNWNILPLQMFHNVDCLGFMIQNKTENKTIVFATDTNALPNIADRYFDCMMLECNYNYDKMLDNSQANKLTSDGYKNHMALEGLVEWLRVRETKPKHLMAIHVSSNGNLDKELAETQLSQFAEHFCFAQKGGLLEI